MIKSCGTAIAESNGRTAAALASPGGDADVWGDELEQVNLSLPENVLHPKPGVYLSLKLEEEPLQRLAALARGASVDDRESQKKIPVLNRVQERLESCMVKPALFPSEKQGVRLVMKLRGRQQILVITEGA